MKIPRKAPTIDRRSQRDDYLKRIPPWIVVPGKAMLSFTTGEPINLARVYLAMAAHANKRTRITRCGQARLAAILGVHWQTIGHNQRKLIALGLVERIARMPPPASVVIYRMIDKIDTPIRKTYKHALNEATRCTAAPIA